MLYHSLEKLVSSLEMRKDVEKHTIQFSNQNFEEFSKFSMPQNPFHLYLLHEYKEFSNEDFLLACLILKCFLQGKKSANLGKL